MLCAFLNRGLDVDQTLFDRGQLVRRRDAVPLDFGEHGQLERLETGLDDRLHVGRAVRVSPFELFDDVLRLVQFTLETADGLLQFDERRLCRRRGLVRDWPLTLISWQLSTKRWRETLTWCRGAGRRS